ncbi:hypothetical protein NEMBOFW57_006830 [Staphylotrichum longicolle]|uniref:Uncharacterized protein n=1 Tax=Staphylotrichum longicolle TaxID=669026 RepID=A0AAD4ETD4_9PEZI|nr:hypothetical protein NEMBOFW57_006830 [Staphylotrichum longicolle]
MLFKDGKTAASWAISAEYFPDTSNHDPETIPVLKLLLPHQQFLYGITGRRAGERPTIHSGVFSRRLPPFLHPFLHPVPIAVDMGRVDVLELIFRSTAPPTPETALEVLAMALDATVHAPDPEVVRTILENTPVDVTALIPRPPYIHTNKWDTYSKRDIHSTQATRPLLPRTSPPPLSPHRLVVEEEHNPEKGHGHGNGHGNGDVTASSSRATRTSSGASACWCGTARAGRSPPCRRRGRRPRGRRPRGRRLGETALDVLGEMLEGQADHAKEGGWAWHCLERLRRAVVLDWEGREGVRR